jgi:Asp-tRNA(Asn)/Glu-tRNA(Gln) amidotransferase B subunit
MGPFDTHGLSEQEARDLIERELERRAASTSFHWETEELDEVLDILTDVIARVIAANNAAISRELRSNLSVPPGTF